MKKQLLSFLAACGLISTWIGVPAQAEDSSGYFYGQLDATSKEIYDLLDSHAADLVSNPTITVEKDLTEAQCQTYVDASDSAISAFRRDHPDIFWCSTWHTSCRGTGNRSSPVFHYTITFQVDYYPNWTTGGRSIAADVSTVQNTVSSLAQQAREAGNTWYDQLLWVHDWFTMNNLYNQAAYQMQSSKIDHMPWTPLAALDPSFSPVCQGYSTAFQLVCDELGIPCISVVSEDHQWNYVRMDDQKWYAIDVTFDDPVYSVNGVKQNNPVSGGEQHDYFLVGKQIFQDQKHHLKSDFRYPELSDANYDAASATHAAGSSQNLVAYPSLQAVNVNGRPVSFQMYALKDQNGNDTNYIKLRDIASVLNGTSAQFQVDWNGSVNILPGQPYTANGSEMTTPFHGTRACESSAAATQISGSPAMLDAIVLKDDAGGAYTYYQLRDLGKALNFQVGWSADRGIFIETTSPTFSTSPISSTSSASPENKASTKNQLVTIWNKTVEPWNVGKLYAMGYTTAVLDAEIARASMDILFTMSSLGEFYQQQIQAAETERSTHIAEMVQYIDGLLPCAQIILDACNEAPELFAEPKAIVEQAISELQTARSLHFTSEKDYQLAKNADHWLELSDALDTVKNQIKAMSN